MRASTSLLALGLFLTPRAEAQAQSSQNCGVTCYIEAFLGDIGAAFGDFAGDASELLGALEDLTSKAEEILGVMQWFDLLNRPKLSAYHVAYKYIQSGRGVPFRSSFDEVMGELALGLVLGLSVGEALGEEDGDSEGEAVGLVLGICDGLPLGDIVGDREGFCDGDDVGDDVGPSVLSQHRR